MEKGGVLWHQIKSLEKVSVCSSVQTLTAKIYSTLSFLGQKERVVSSRINTVALPAFTKEAKQAEDIEETRKDR